MKKLLEDMCIKHKMAIDNSTTFQQVQQGHPLYECKGCSGKVGSCPNFASHNDLYDSQYVKFCEDIDRYNR